MAFYFALLNVSNAHLDNRMHHGNRRSRSSSSRPTHADRRHSFSSMTSNEAVNDYRLLPRPRILSSQSVVRPPTPPQRRSSENIADNAERNGESSSGTPKTERRCSRDRCDSSTSTCQPKNLTQNQLRNIKKVTFETDRNGDVVDHHTRGVSFLGDPEAWVSETTGSQTVGHRQPSGENHEIRWKWIAKLRNLSVEQRELKAHRQNKLLADASTADGETEIWECLPPPTYPGIIDTPREAPIKTSFEESSESSFESASRSTSDRSSVGDLFDEKQPNKRKFSGIHRISRKPWRIITESSALDASWRTTKSVVTSEIFERIFSNRQRSDAFRILGDNANCSEPISVVN
uniref:Uncharacterized protein n=1 Tax=Steinernema glaseri TaxID=37863 RepID=A0A1I8AW48_9BILA